MRKTALLLTLFCSLTAAADDTNSVLAKCYYRYHLTSEKLHSYLGADEDRNLAPLADLVLRELNKNFNKVLSFEQFKANLVRHDYTGEAMVAYSRYQEEIRSSDVALLNELQVKLQLFALMVDRSMESVDYVSCVRTQTIEGIKALPDHSNYILGKNSIVEMMTAAAVK